MMVNNLIDGDEYNKLLKLANSIGWSPNSLYAAYFGSPSNSNIGNIQSKTEPISSPNLKLPTNTKITPTYFRSSNNYPQENCIIDLSVSLEKQHIEEDASKSRGLPKPMQLFSDEIESKCRPIFKQDAESSNSTDCKYKYNEDYHVQKVLTNGWHLFDHQLHAINECLRLERVILAFDMGLGKTIIALSWAKAVSRSMNFTCLTVVISPCTLIDNWKREASVLDFQQINKSLYLNESNASIILFASWAQVPDILTINKHLGRTCNSYIIIADEAHAIQNFRSQRTQALLKLTSQHNCLGVVLSTGTPMKNGRPANLLPLLVAIRHPIATNRMEYERRYCNAKKTRFCPWDTSGASNLQELKRNIGPFILRKTKEECLDLPPLMRSIQRIAIEEKWPKEVAKIIDTLKSSARKGKENPTSPNVLEVMSKLRKTTSIAKVSGTSTFIVTKLLKSCRDPVVVFVWFQETARLLQQQIQTDSGKQDGCGPLVCRTLTGEMLIQQERQKLVDSFQGGEVDVLICSFGVGSVGLTLTRSHTVILLDRPWTPGDVLQAEDRVRRIGQKASTVESFWISAFDYDSKLDALLQKKNDCTQKVIGATTDAKLLVEESSKENRKVGVNMQLQKDQQPQKNGQKAIAHFFLPVGDSSGSGNNGSRKALAERAMDTNKQTVVLDKRKRKEVEPSPNKNDATNMFNAIDDDDEDGGGEASILKKLVHSILLP